MPDREMKGTASARFDGQQVGDGPRWASIAEVSVLAQQSTDGVNHGKNHDGSDKLL